MKTLPDQLQRLRELQAKTAGSFLPEFYRLNRPAERERFDKLLELPGLSVTDHITEQVQELIKSRNPGKRLAAEELHMLVISHFGKTDPRDYGVWVFYPWSRRLVHLLDQEEFVDVRTSRNLYKITREERDTLAKKKIGVIGLSVGQSVSVTLAMERVCGEIRLADFDLLELTNLNRIRTGVHNLGLAKVYSVAREIAEIDPYIRVKCFPEGLTENNLDDFFLKDGKLDLLIEESDGFDIKILSRYKARELKVPVLMEASDRCMVDVERFDLEPDRKILHGIVKHLDVDTLKALTTNEEKIPYMLDILGLRSTSPRLRASMLEMQQTINTWPQLASAVTMGGGITADVARRILLNHFTSSGRYYVDIDQLIGDDKEKTKVQVAETAVELTEQKITELIDGLGTISSCEIAGQDLKKILEAALMAPSQANRQPWKWYNCKGNLFLFHDSSQGLRQLDPDAFNSIVSLGCALENANQQAAELGFDTQYKFYPLKNKQELVAWLSFTKSSTKTNSNTLAPFITKRKTNRSAAKSGALPSETLADCKKITGEVKGAQLQFITGREKMTKLATLLAICEKFRLLDPVLHQEYFSKEIIYSGLGAAGPIQGVSRTALMLPPALDTALDVISAPEVAGLLREWNKGQAIGNITSSHVANSPAAGLITMPGDSVEELLRGGMAAEKLWLHATKINLAIQPICLPLSFSRRLGKADKSTTEQNFIDFEALRDSFSLLFDDLKGRKAVFLFRLFVADDPAGQALRRPFRELCFNC